MKPVGYIYKLINSVNDKVYIGGTTLPILTRFGAIKSSSKNGKCRIDKGIREVGVQNFSIVLIKTCYSIEQLRFSEKYFIAKYQSNDKAYGYNATKGGDNIKTLKYRAVSTENNYGYLAITIHENIKTKIVKLAKDQERSLNSIVVEILTQAFA